MRENDRPAVAERLRLTAKQAGDDDQLVFERLEPFQGQEPR